MTISSTPAGVSVAPRHMHFNVDQDLETLWHGGDVFRTAFFNALSLQFPDGEQQFINAVRLYRDRVDDSKLSNEIRGFIGQEALHSREHKHYTAVLANSILKHPDWMNGATPEMARLWRWHAIEETEHKSVAFDVYQHCVGDDKLRRLVFLFVTWNFFKYTFLNTCTLLKADGKLWSLSTWSSGMNFLWGKPGVIRKCLPDFLAYLKKGFHPWQQDNRELIDRNLSELDRLS
ncbi:metal-dependent hydrolase [Marinobacter confluentis]|uniref:Metal-dependent hydrolase n=1 Tax=Marinobacter confluentis TaxID=1697557 RepID=A0A4Z1BUK8_9GAMM|nr:metal-dependent hydrolase [Marinobacter confluentis]TGN41159.1 metal-dependent hydrolase [Marinobacter confluentis]